MTPRLAVLLRVKYKYNLFLKFIYSLVFIDLYTARPGKPVGDYKGIVLGQ